MRVKVRLPKSDFSWEPMCPLLRPMVFGKRHSHIAWKHLGNLEIIFKMKKKILQPQNINSRKSGEIKKTPYVIKTI